MRGGAARGRALGEGIAPPRRTPAISIRRDQLGGSRVGSVASTWQRCGRAPRGGARPRGGPSGQVERGGRVRAGRPARALLLPASPPSRGAPDGPSPRLRCAGAIEARTTGDVATHARGGPDPSRRHPTHRHPPPDITAAISARISRRRSQRHSARTVASSGRRRPPRPARQRQDPPRVSDSDLVRRRADPSPGACVCHISARSPRDLRAISARSRHHLAGVGAFRRIRWRDRGRGPIALRNSTRGADSFPR